MEPGPSKVENRDCDTFSAFSCVQIEDTSANPEKAGNYDEDFGDFAIATSTCNAEGDLWAPTNEAKSSSTSWADFHTALYPSSSNSRDNLLNVNSLIDQFDRLVCASFPDVASGSQGPRIVRQLETLATLLRENNPEVDGLPASESSVAQKLWQSLRSVEEAMALQFKWNDSLLYSIYLTTLGMNMQLAQTTKCPYPAFAAQLTQASLKPEKCSDAAPISPVLTAPTSSIDSSFTGVNPAAVLLNPPVNKDLSIVSPPKTGSKEANSFPLDIFSLSIDEAMSATKPTWQEDLEQLGLMEKSTNQKSNFQPLSNGTIGAATNCVPKSTVNVLPVLPPPPAGMLIRHKLEPK